MHLGANEEDDVFEDLSSEWKVQRIKTMTIFVLQLFALAIDEYIALNLMPDYIKVSFPSDDFKTYEILLVVSYSIGTIAFQVILGRNADQTRKIRRLLLLCNLCSVLGNVIYALPYSILLFIIGRFIRGIGSSVYAIVIGEVMRSYIPRDLCRAISMCFIGTVIGELLGPALASSLKKAHFKILTLQMRHENALILTTAGIFFLVFMLTAVLASDLSFEFDLKANYQELVVRRRSSNEHKAIGTQTESESDTERSRSDEQQQLFGSTQKGEPEATADKGRKIAYGLARNPITLSILWASFVLSHTRSLFQSQITSIAEEKVMTPQNYGSVIQTLTTLTAGATYLVVGILGEKVGDVPLVYAAYALTIICGACWLSTEFITMDSQEMLSIFVIYLATLSISSCGRIALQLLMGKLVTSNIQCLTEAIRLCFVRLGTYVASLLFQVELSIPLLSGALLAAVNVVTIAVVNMNYKYFADPKPIIQISSRKYY